MKSIDTYDKVILLNPNFKLGYVYRGQLNNLLGLYEEAAKDFAMALNLDPYDSDV